MQKCFKYIFKYIFFCIDVIFLLVSSFKLKIVSTFHLVIIFVLNQINISKRVRFLQIQWLRLLTGIYMLDVLCTCFAN